MLKWRLYSYKRRVLSALWLALLAVACSDNNELDPDDPVTASDFPVIELNGITSGFIQPLQITHAPDGSGRLFVVERGGRVWTIKGDSVPAAPFLDLSGVVNTAGSEQGLLGIAFPPDYADAGVFYANYTDEAGDTVISQFAVGGTPASADPGSETRLLKFDQPFANHNGGQMAFGPAGYLYIGLGDGGGSGDPGRNAQNLNTPLGAILRIDVDHSSVDYAIPQSNPFDENAVWVYGLRNPWRFSFDRDTGDLYIADVGQSFYEEINIQTAGSRGGENYGWNIMEGSQCYETLSCDPSGLEMPVAEYDHQDGDCSVTGGYVYRGQRHPGLQGVYFYADFCSGKLWGLKREGGEWVSALLRDTDLKISTFGEDQAGNLYLADYAAGAVYRIDRGEQSRRTGHGSGRR